MGLTSELFPACPSIWEAKTVCHAWGKPAAVHGCQRRPDHPGICRCACGKPAPPKEN